MKLTLAQYQEKLIIMFEKINNEFKKHQINWYAHAGTLLGIIRNGKMIPWDDDIDMSLTDKEFFSNFNKIEQIVNELGYELRTIFNSNKIDLIVKIIDNKNTYIIQEDHVKQINCQINPFIDIFISINKDIANSRLKQQYLKILSQFAIPYNNDRFPSSGYLFKNYKKVKLSKLFKYPNLIFKIVFPKSLYNFLVINIYKNSLKKTSDEYIVWNPDILKKTFVNINNLIPAKFYNNEVLINKFWKEELEYQYGKNLAEEDFSGLKYPHHLFEISLVNNK